MEGKCHTPYQFLLVVKIMQADWPVLGFRVMDF